MGTRIPSKCACMMCLDKNGFRQSFRRLSTGERFESGAESTCIHSVRLSAIRDTTARQRSSLFLDFSPAMHMQTHTVLTVAQAISSDWIYMVFFNIEPSK